MIVFDLDDTLSESKTNISEEMTRLLHAMLCDGKLDENGDITEWNYSLGIISGCAYEQFEKQFLEPFWEHVENNDAWGREVWAESILARTFLMPASGSQLYFYDRSGGWKCAYKEALVLREKTEIYNTFYEACENVNILPLIGSYGEVAEDRDSQVTFSFFGQQAPLEIKKPWDPDQKKRLEVAKEMKRLLKEAGQEDKYEITVGGSSSIDVTLKGRDKAYGMQKFLDWDEWRHVKLKTLPEQVLFVADALFPGGNDYSVKQLGIECVEVSCPADTEKVIKGLLGEE